MQVRLKTCEGNCSTGSVIKNIPLEINNMKRSPLRKVGKIGLRNKEANKINYGRFAEMGVTSCEICGSTFACAAAHKHPREWYRSCPDLLSDFSQILFLCQSCHDRIDDRSQTTKTESDEIFERLRS